MVDRERNLELLKRRNLTFDKVMVIQMILGGILGVCVAYLSDVGFFGDTVNSMIDYRLLGLLVFLIVEAILIETGYIREYEHLLKKKEE